MPIPCQQLLPLACVTPWVHAWGALNMAGVTDGSFFPFVSESGALAAASAPLANCPFPRTGGVIKFIVFQFRTTSIAVDLVWNLVLDNVDQNYGFTVPAGALTGAILTPFRVPAGLAQRLIRPRFTCAAPGAASTRPVIIIGAEA